MTLPFYQNSVSVSEFGSVLNFRDSRKQHPIAKKIITLLCHSSNDVILAWVHAHRDIAGNESADGAANNVSRSFPFLKIPILIEDFRRYARHEILLKWFDIWYHTLFTNKFQNIKTDTSL